MNTLFSSIASQSPYLKDLGLALLRIGIGAVFFRHGLGKLLGGTDRWLWLGQQMSHLGITFAPLFWGLCAALSDFIGSIMLILGLGTRVAALFMAFSMVVAIIFHYAQGDDWNAISHPLSILVVFLSLIVAGSGAYSLDHWLLCRTMSSSKSHTHDTV